MLAEKLSKEQKEKHTALLLQRCEEECAGLGIDAHALEKDEAMIFGKMSLDVADIEAQLKAQTTSALRELKFQMYELLTF